MTQLIENAKQKHFEIDANFQNYTKIEALQAKITVLKIIFLLHEFWEKNYAKVRKMWNRETLAKNLQKVEFCKKKFFLSNFCKKIY